MPLLLVVIDTVDPPCQHGVLATRASYAGEREHFGNDVGWIIPVERAILVETASICQARGALEEPIALL